MTIYDFKQALTKTVVPALSKLPYQLWPKSIRGNFIPIFMLHRFECKDVGLEGHSVQLVEQCFEFLRKNNYDIITIEEAVYIYKERLPLKKPTVAFSIDDGYWDQFEIGIEIFKKYDIPVTYFITTNMINSNQWTWDSKIEFLIESSQDPDLLNDIRSSFNIPHSSKKTMLENIVFKLKRRNAADIENTITKMAETLCVEVSVEAVSKNRYMSWDDVLLLEKEGVRIGPHTRSHHILSSLSIDEVQDEILGSWIDIKEKVKNPTPVFCYPIGKKGDYGSREIDILKCSELKAAVTALPGSMRLMNRTGIYEIPRYAMPDSLIDFKQYATWVEEYKYQYRARR